VRVTTPVAVGVTVKLWEAAEADHVRITVWPVKPPPLRAKVMVPV
jgi:hypothetical protein